MSGCSALFMSRPPLGDGPLPSGTCSTLPVAPVLDVAMGALWGVVTVAGATTNEEVENRGAVVATAGLMTAGWGYSAAKGFGWTSECRLRQALSEQAISDHLRVLAREARARDDS